MIIACSDSRVDPSQIFDVDPGEILVVRNVAALVPPFETTPGHHGVSAALEFAVQVLEVSHIVVMHSDLCYLKSDSTTWSREWTYAAHMILCPFPVPTTPAR